MEVATISAFRPDEKKLINEKDCSNEHPIKISRIELLENDLTADSKSSKSISTEPESAIAKSISKNLETENDDCSESTIVTADYIQQSMIFITYKSSQI